MRKLARMDASGDPLIVSWNQVPTMQRF